MKIVFPFLLLLLIPGVLYSQTQMKADSQQVDTIKPGKGPRDEQLKQIKEKKAEHLNDSASHEPPQGNVDTTLLNKYGDLLNDDPEFNKRYSVWIPLAEIVAVNGLIWAVDRYVLKYDFARISSETWKENLRGGWEWDHDGFGTNFISHPYAGNLYFNAARSNGYNYLQSSLFAATGSLMWEYFGENTKPSYNDIINTPVSGAFLGEILYRISSNILDDRTTGFNRVYREVFARILNSMRGVNRLLQGKTSRVTNHEVYQEEPLNISLYTGIHTINSGLRPLESGAKSVVPLSVQLDYGNPFENRPRKPFDLFRFLADFDFGTGGSILSNITGYGILTGKNISNGTHSMLAGAFQYYDYWNNNTFELGTIGLGGAILSKLSLGKSSNLYTNLHLAGVPFAGNSTHFGPDTTSRFRDYNFGYGVQGKIEATLVLFETVTAAVVYHSYWIRTYDGIPGDNYIGIFKPRIAVRLFRSLSIGAEHFVYDNTRKVEELPAIHSVRSEQKFYLEDKQRRGRYN